MLEKIILNGYCVGCGACASVSDAQYKMEFTKDGRYRPIPLSVVNKTEQRPLCPFLDEYPNEDQLSDQLYGLTPGIIRSHDTGYYLRNFAGHVAVGDYRRDGSSGGMATWLLGNLLESGLVDGVLHVKPNRDDGALFKYGVSTSVAELRTGAKSRYYPVEMSKVIEFVRVNPGRYVFVGVPCFVKAVRLLTLTEPILAERIVYAVSLVCGHLKSDRFAKTMAWEMGIHPDDLRSFDFRVKREGHSASDYGVEATGFVEKDLVSRQAMTKDLLGADWGKGLFKLSACDYCDDVIGETADVSIGDAWLPAYVDDPKGSNVVTVRSPEILTLIEQRSSELQLDEIGIEDVLQSQAGGFRHRREGLAYRLHLKDSAGAFRPRKRVGPSAELAENRKRIYESRLELVVESDEAYERARAADDLEVLRDHLQPILAKHDALATATFKGRLAALLARFPLLYRVARTVHRVLPTVRP